MSVDDTPIIERAPEFTEIIHQLNRLRSAVEANIVPGDKRDKILLAITQAHPDAFTLTPHTIPDPWNNLNYLLRQTSYAKNLVGPGLFDWVEQMAGLCEASEKRALAERDAHREAKRAAAPLNLGDRIKEQSSYTTSDGQVFTSFDEARVHEARRTFGELWAQEFGSSMHAFPEVHDILDWIKTNKAVVMPLLMFANGDR